jgi:hypothetical protein
MYCVFTADHLKKENLVISQKKRRNCISHNTNRTQ